MSIKTFLPGFILFTALLSCSRSDPQGPDDSSAQILTFELSDANVGADLLVVDKGGRFFLYDDEREDGGGALYFGPDITDQTSEGLTVIVDNDGIPTSASLGKSVLIFDAISDSGVDMTLLEEGQSPVFFYGVNIPGELEVEAGRGFMPHLKTNYDPDGQIGKAKLAYFFKCVSFTLSAISTVYSKSLGGLISLWVTGYNEFEKSSKGYDPHSAEAASDVNIALAVDDFLSGGDISNLALSLWAVRLNDIADDMFNQIHLYPDLNPDSELYDYYLKLSPGDERVQGSSNAYVINCGPEEGVFYLNVDTKSQWYLDYNHEGWFSGGAYIGNGREQIAIAVAPNETPMARTAVIVIRTPMEGERFNGSVWLCQEGNEKGYLELSDQNVHFPKEGGTQKIRITKKSSDIDYWYVWGEPSWLRVDHTDSESFSLTTGPNESTSENIARIYVTAKSKGYAKYSYTVSLLVSQDKKEWSQTSGAVDLGLSVKWAACNLGASAPEEYGNYYAWGETAPKACYDWSTYKWCKGSYNTMTKYCSESSSGYNGFTDNKTILDPEDDAAAVNLGGSWRMATWAEWVELKTSCTWTWRTLNGVKGRKVTSKKTGYTDKWIFLPAAGYRSGTNLYHVGSRGDYWSSSRDSYYQHDGCYQNFGSDLDGQAGWHIFHNRYYGFSVRPVSE